MIGLPIWSKWWKNVRISKQLALRNNFNVPKPRKRNSVQIDIDDDDEMGDGIVLIQKKWFIRPICTIGKLQNTN